MLLAVIINGSRCKLTDCLIEWVEITVEGLVTIFIQLDLSIDAMFHPDAYDILSEMKSNSSYPFSISAGFTKMVC
jgi:hypothetical protein